MREIMSKLKIVRGLYIMKKAIVAATAVALTFSAATSANAKEVKQPTKKVVKVKSKAGKSIVKKTTAVSSDAKKVKKAAKDYFKVVELPPLSRSYECA